MAYFLYQTRVMNSIILGIDVSNDTFDTAMLINNKVQTKKFNNNALNVLTN
ncbi:IS110 family transposase [Orientia tsutsugamushi]|uniref:IS110 family transposase n=1 Tax=Orientia tsutsugamushi TaxID=784 RepID=A0A2U3RSX5_ORITS|nr:hypothetical protein OTSKARP_0296 [Orientia tsutsugamushi str. Karp]SPR16323.1 IS110 family transposase [Orientia tsutsugamushi]